MIAEYSGKTKFKKERKRNGSTMGHSKNQLLAILDLPNSNFGKKAKISYDGKVYPVKRILGILPFKMLIQQTQGGISSGTFKLQHKTNDLLTSIHGRENISQDWDLSEDEDILIVQQKKQA